MWLAIVGARVAAMPNMKSEARLPKRGSLEVGIAPMLDAVEWIMNMLLANALVAEDGFRITVLASPVRFCLPARGAN